MSGPLSSLKVLDFSTLLPGPFCSLYLADMGAEVLRIESPTRQDLVRVIPPYADGVSTAHAYLNRNKRSLALDLKQPEAIDIVKQLLADHDITERNGKLAIRISGVDIKELDEKVKPHNSEIDVLIFKEAIHNIIKYSKAGEVQITLSKNGNFLSLTISDNGTGFTTSEMRSGGNGLNNMKQRAIDSGGSFDISSPLGLGTTIVVRFPIHTTQFW